MINRAFELTELSEVNFIDVSEDDWFYEDVSKALAAKYTKGYTDKTFKPNNPITREEASAMVFRVLNLEELDKVAAEFDDSDKISNWAIGYVNAVKEAGYIQGHNNLFRPDEGITRAEAAKILHNILTEDTDKPEEPNGPPTSDKPSDPNPQRPSPQRPSPRPTPDLPKMRLQE